jgi:hypothetical protein
MMTDHPGAIPGFPIVEAAQLDDGVVIATRGGPIFIGVRPLSWTERTFRELANARLGDSYDWLGWPRHATMTGRQILDRLRGVDSKSLD